MHLVLFPPEEVIEIQNIYIFPNMVDLYMCSYNSRVDDYIKCVLSV